MKKIATILCLSALAAAVQSQSYTIKANTGENTGKQLTITFEHDIAYVLQSEIPNDQTLKPAVFNLTNLPIENGTIVIPNDGANYWFVPFDNPEVNVPAPSSTVIKYRCECIGSSEDPRRSCRRTNDSNSRQVECGGIGCSCELISAIMTAGGNQEEHTGSFVLIQAKKIVFQ